MTSELLSNLMYELNLKAPMKLNILLKKIKMRQYFLNAAMLIYLKKICVLKHISGF